MAPDLRTRTPGLRVENGRQQRGRQKGRAMKKKQFTTEQIIGILREGNASGSISAVCRKHGL
jgi:hypothetical protein